MSITSKPVTETGRFGRCLLPAIALLIICQADGLASEIVGAVGAANAKPTARAPHQAQRDLKPGDDVFFKDRIATGNGGSAQITFLDRSTLNVGENSEIVIDDFVYKPGTAGTMRAKLNRGMLRYVGGDISHSGGANIETPVATIGIRGGIGMIGYVKNAAAIASVPGVPHDFKGGTIVINSYGTMTVSNSTSETVIRRPGFAVFMNNSARSVSTPVRLDPSSIQTLMRTVGSRNGQHGGASVAARSKASAVSSAVAATLDVPVAVSLVPSNNGLDYTSVFSAGNAFVRVRSQAQQAMQLQQSLSAAALLTPVVVTAPVMTPVVPAPVLAPVVTVPVVTPVVTTPLVTPVVTVPVVTPVVTTPLVTPVVTGPVVTPVVTTPAVTPVVTAPVVTPVVTAPMVTPVVTTLAVTPVVTAPMVTPVVTTLVVTPVVTAHVVTPVVTAPVVTLVVTIPVVTTPVVATGNNGNTGNTNNNGNTGKIGNGNTNTGNGINSGKKSSD